MNKKLLIAVLLVLAVGSVAWGFRYGLRFKDFHWESAALFLRGENPYQWFFDGRDFQGVAVDATQAPSTIAFILPYGLFSHYVGNALWAVSNVVFLGMFWFFVSRFQSFRVSKFQGFKVSKFQGFKVSRFQGFKVSGRETLLVLFAVFALGSPCRVVFETGQGGLFSLAFFAAAYWAMERKKPFWLVGFLMAVSLFKYTFAVPLAFIFLFRRQWKAMAVCAGIHAGLTVLMGWWTGTNPVTLVLQSMKIGTILNPCGGDADWAAMAHFMGMDIAVPSLVGYAVFGVLLFVLSFAGSRDSLLKLATFAVIANVMFYHRVYDFVTLVFPLIYAVLHREEKGTVARAIRYATYATVGYTFFVGKVFYMLQSPMGVPIAFALEHALLFCLLLKCFSADKNDSDRVLSA